MVTPDRHIAAMEKIGVLVGVRERCIKETRERLIKCGFTSEEVDDAVDTALRVNMINELRYTRAFIRGKSHLGWGRLKIINQLRQNNIPEETIDACFAEFPSSQDEYSMAMKLICKKKANSKDPYATYMRRLISRGFSYDVSQSVVKEYLSCQ